ncbi:hypothetical protein BGZ83_012013 [Gryganskiella cystojenkinii]|nr:hypothetical protein BGZ83_012013 [Gryganskiella cystojenkinii]
MAAKGALATSLPLLSTLALALFSSLFSTVHAYDAPPAPRRLVVSAKYNNKLYLQGGHEQLDYTGQLMSLDLSVNWTTSQGAWTTTGLPDGPSTSRHGMVAVPPQFSAGLGPSTQGYLLLIGSSNNVTATFWNSFDLQTNIWSSVVVTAQAPTPANTYPHLQGQTAVTDPNTGLVYVIGGFWNTTYNRLMIMNPANKTLLHNEAAANVNTSSLTSASAVWSTVRKTILVFGGSRVINPNQLSGIGLDSIPEYNPATSAWTSMTTSGDIPTRRLDHCAAANDDGTKIILFGGSLDSNTFFNTIYILDIATGKWTQGKPAPQFRTRMACTFNQHQFIAWGGSSGDDRSTMLEPSVAVYDVDYDQWSLDYSSVTPTAPPPPVPSSGGNDNGSSGGGSKMSGAVIGGAAAGGAAVLALSAIAVFLFYRNRKMKEEVKQQAMKDDARVAAAIAEGNYHDEDDSDRYKRYRHSGSASAGTPKFGPASTMSNVDVTHGAKVPYGDSINNSPDHEHLLAQNRRESVLQQQYLQQQRPFDQYASAASSHRGQAGPISPTHPNVTAAAAAASLGETRPYTGYTDAFSDQHEHYSLVPPSSSWSQTTASRPQSGVVTGNGAIPVQSHDGSHSGSFVIHHPLHKIGSSNPPPVPIPATPPFQSTSTAAMFLGAAAEHPGSKPTHAYAVRTTTADGISIPPAIYTTVNAGATPFMYPMDEMGADMQTSVLAYANSRSPSPGEKTESAAMSHVGPNSGQTSSQMISAPESPPETTNLPARYQQLPRQVQTGTTSVIGSSGTSSASIDTSLTSGMGAAYHQQQHQQNAAPNPTPFQVLAPYQPAPYQPGPNRAKNNNNQRQSLQSQQSQPHSQQSREEQDQQLADLLHHHHQQQPIQPSTSYGIGDYSDMTSDHREQPPNSTFGPIIVPRDQGGAQRTHRPRSPTALLNHNQQILEHPTNDYYEYEEQQQRAQRPGQGQDSRGGVVISQQYADFRNHYGSPAPSMTSSNSDQQLQFPYPPIQQQQEVLTEQHPTSLIEFARQKGLVIPGVGGAGSSDGGPQSHSQADSDYVRPPPSRTR